MELKPHFNPEHPICGIYLIISPTGCIYIGQSINIQRRIYRYDFNPPKSQTRLYNSINKYGFGSHVAEILIICDFTQLNFWETFYIKLFETNGNRHGLNLNSGGCAPAKKVSEETRKKMSQSLMGHKRLVGTKWSEKRRIMWNTEWTPKGRKMGENEKLARLQTRYRRPVNQYSLSGIFIRRWESMTQAEVEAGFNSNNIQQVCKGFSVRRTGSIKLRFTYMGYRWQYAELNK